MYLARFVAFVVCISLTSTELKKVRRLQSYNPRKCNQKNHGKSCASLYKSGVRKDGLYTVNPDFYRGWSDYKAGFGSLNGEFWLGLDKIHHLSKSGQDMLRVDLTDFDSTTAYAKYGTFTVASVSDSYRLKVGRFSGNAGDSLIYHNGMKFSTKDRDNDQVGSNFNCAVQKKGAWWYKGCYKSNLNGVYLNQVSKNSGIRINWYTIGKTNGDP